MKRRAASLLETTVAVALSGIVLSLVATMLVGMWKAERRYQADLNERRSLSRLELALRQDVHLARRGESIEGRRLVLDLGEASNVEYTVDQNRILRVKTTGESVIHRETYTMAAGAKITIDADKAEAPARGLARLTVEPASSIDPVAGRFGRSAVLEAAIGIGQAPTNQLESAP